jgi:glycosyltransferase involved in cell wall biosynthesis
MSDEPRPIRVLHCLWSGEIGGAERAVYQLVREQLSDPGVEPAFLFGQGRGRYWEAARELGCPVIALDLPNGRAFWATGRVATSMRGFDVHHFHSPEPLLMMGSLRCRGVTRVFTRRGGTTELDAGKRLRYLLIREMLKRGFQGYTANTAHAARTGAGLFGIDERRFTVVYNGIEFDLLEPNRPPSEVRAELGLDSDAFVLGTAANLKAWKRIDRLVTALADIDDSRMRLLVLGDGAERVELEATASRLGVADRAIFAGSRPHVADYLQVMDAFSLPSAAPESFGNAAVEAMALAVPTIVFSDGGGLVEHITQDETGFIVDDQSELERAVRRLQTDPDLRRRIGEAGRSSVRSRYTLERAADGYRRAYANAIQATSRRARHAEGS